jgi:hypothetical protein
MVASKLKAARDRNRREAGRKVEGRKSYAEMSPDLVRLAKRLHRYPVNGKRRSLRDVSKALASSGFLSSSAVWRCRCRPHSWISAIPSWRTVAS